MALYASLSFWISDALSVEAGRRGRTGRQSRRHGTGVPAPGGLQDWRLGGRREQQAPRADDAGGAGRKADRSEKRAAGSWTRPEWAVHVASNFADVARGGARTYRVNAGSAVLEQRRPGEAATTAPTASPATGRAPGCADRASARAAAIR